MSDETKPEATAEATGTVPEAKTPEQPEKTFTQSQVEEIVKSRLARVKKEPKPEPTAASPKETPSTADPTVLELKQRLDFAEAMNELDHKPSKDDRQLYQDVFKLRGIDGIRDLVKMATRSAVPAVTEPAPAKTEEPKYKSPGAPAGAPAEVLNRDATKWPGTYIQRLQEDGTFLKELNKYHQSMPGGSNGLFKPRIPGK